MNSKVIFVDRNSFWVTVAMNSEQRNHSDGPTGINVDDWQQRRRKFDLG